MLFDRPEETYDYPEGLIESLLNDHANPVRHTAGLLRPGMSVLDVGAGSGLLARIAKALVPDANLDGIEISARAATVAAPHYRNFYVGFAEEHLKEIAQAKYDVVVLNDVIEHVADPVSLLRQLACVVAPNCRFIISTPNVAYVGARLSLLDGRFDYVDSGIMERTHLRFFTLSTLQCLFSEAELNIASLTYLKRKLRETEFASTATRRNLFALRRILADETATTYQFLFVLDRQPKGTRYCPSTVGNGDRLYRLAIRARSTTHQLAQNTSS